jgi:uncharacterized membrane protein
MYFFTILRIDITFQDGLVLYSYRKVSHLADGSLIKTNLNLKFNLKKDNLFSLKKYIIYS